MRIRLALSPVSGADQSARAASTAAKRLELKPKPTTGRLSLHHIGEDRDHARAVIAEKYPMKAFRIEDLIGTTMSEMPVMRMAVYYAPGKDFRNRGALSSRKSGLYRPFLLRTARSVGAAAFAAGGSAETRS